MLIYKILLPEEWATFEADGTFTGSPFDVTSGFIHCSAREQVAATAQRVFGADPDLVLVGVDADALGDLVRWEESAGRGTFPHIYGALPMSAVTEVHRVSGAPAVHDVLPLT